MTKPAHLGIEFDRFPELWYESDIAWVVNKDAMFEARIRGVTVAWMERRPWYCDRGRVKIDTSLPGVDVADGFPRYYMREDVGKQEIEEWLRWRLWRKR